MKNVQKLFNGFWSVLKQPADDCGLFPIVARIGVYGFLLGAILFVQSQTFDANELLTIVGFTSIVTVIEMMWRKSGAGKHLIWHFSALLLLVAFLATLLNQAVHVREAWYRTHVLEGRIEDLIATSPTAVVVADGLGNIKYVNSHATDVIGWTNQDVAGKPLTMLMRPHKTAAHNKAFGQAVQDLKEGTADWIYTGDRVFRVVHKSGEVIKAQIYIVGIRFSSNLETGKYPVGQDTEFYAILLPVGPIIDPEEAAEKARNKIEADTAEEKEDRKQTEKAKNAHQ